MLVRSIVFAASFVGISMVVEPRELLSKVSRRLSVRRKARNVHRISRLEELESAGEYSLLLQERLGLLNLRGKAVQFRTINQLKLFEHLLREVEDSSDVPRRKVENAVPLYYVSSSLPFTNSGYSLRTAHLAAATKAAGVAIEAVTRVGYPVVAGKIALKQSSFIEGVQYSRLIPWFHIPSAVRRIDRATEQLQKFVQVRNTTILHTTTDFENAAIVRRVANELQIPWIYEIRGEREKTWLSNPTLKGRERQTSSENYQIRRNLETKYAQAADGVIALSEVSKNDLIERGVPSHKIHVVPNSVSEKLLNLKIDKQLLRTELGLDDGVWIGAITAVVGYEGLDTMLLGLLELPENLKLVVVGSGDSLTRLKKLAEDIGVLPRVWFVGKVEHDQVWKWYASIDALVVPRRNDPVCRTVTPLKPLEAMALGIPVVASDLPALREVTGSRACYFEADNPKDLAEKIIEVLAGLYDYGGAREWAKTRSWKHSAAELRLVYEKFTK